MRCIALAQAWQDEGGKVVFLSHCESDVLRERIIREGFEFVPIDHPHPHPSDLEQTLSTMKNICHFTFDISQNSPSLSPFPFPLSPTWLILDGYHFTPEYQKAIKDAGIRLLVIDDMNHLPYYHADIILNQNIHATELKYNCDPDTKLLLGPKYVLLRREFLKYKDFKREIPDKARKILVTMGGADPDNVTLKVIQALNLLGDPELEVKVVIGPSNPHIDSLRETVLHSPFSVLLLHGVDNMADLMAWADVAITAGGSTCWELAYMGVPSILIVLAKNQELLAENLTNQRWVLNLGWHRNVNPSKIVNTIANLINNKQVCGTGVENAMKIVDGGGVKRILSELEQKIMLRPVREEDCKLIWTLSNDGQARKASFYESLIPWDEHVQWFKSKLTDPSHYFYIIMDRYEKPIGQIRFSVESGKGIVSFSIAREFRGLGLSARCLRLGTQRFFLDSGVSEIMAFVKADNEVSLRVFQKVGFERKEKISLHGVESYKLILYRGK